MKPISLLLLSISAAFTGCAGVAIESARMTAAASARSQYMDAALAGDAEAQYRVGKSYCCTPRQDADAFYDTRKATDFLCLAARQRHAAAAYEIGKIHSGDTVQGLRLIRRAATWVMGDTQEEQIVAFYWFDRAGAWGHADAQRAAEATGLKAAPPFSDPAMTPCTIDEVYGPAG